MYYSRELFNHHIRFLLYTNARTYMGIKYYYGYISCVCRQCLSCARTRHGFKVHIHHYFINTTHAFTRNSIPLQTISSIHCSAYNELYNIHKFALLMGEYHSSKLVEKCLDYVKRSNIQIVQHLRSQLMSVLFKG